MSKYNRCIDGYLSSSDTCMYLMLTTWEYKYYETKLSDSVFWTINECIFKHVY